MIRKIAEYEIDPQHRESVEKAIADFVAAIRDKEPRTTYEAYRRGQGPSCIHFMTFPDAEAERAHQTAPYTQRFVEVLYPKCVAEPSFTDLGPVEAAGA